MGIFITGYMRRSTSELITFRDAAGAAITINASDNVRIKIGRSGEAPLLDITSGEGNSRVTDANPATLTLNQDDLVVGTIKPGVYDLEASVVDSADGNLIKHAESGIFTLLDTPLGGLT